jgi:hypothetical protein
MLRGRGRRVKDVPLAQELAFVYSSTNPMALRVIPRASPFSCSDCCAIRNGPQASARGRLSSAMTGTNRGSTRDCVGRTVRGMKPFIIFGLWAVLGLDAGAWAEAFVGIPAGVGIVICVGIGAALAVAARQRIAAASTAVRDTAAHVSMFDGTSTLDRAA